MSSEELYRPDVATMSEDKPKRFRCDTTGCDKAFVRKSDLQRHGRIHSNERPFLCEMSGCGKMFIQRSALTVHIRTHTGEKPHRCQHAECGKRFADSSSLARHRRIHAGRRPSKCQHAGCPKSYCRKKISGRQQGKSSDRNTSTGYDNSSDSEDGDSPSTPASDSSSTWIAPMNTLALRHQSADTTASAGHLVTPIITCSTNRADQVPTFSIATSPTSNGAAYPASGVRSYYVVDQHNPGVATMVLQPPPIQTRDLKIKTEHAEQLLSSCTDYSSAQDSPCYSERYYSQHVTPTSAGPMPGPPDAFVNAMYAQQQQQQPRGPSPHEAYQGPQALLQNQWSHFAAYESSPLLLSAPAYTLPAFNFGKFQDVWGTRFDDCASTMQMPNDRYGNA